MSLSINILISTIGERIDRVARIPLPPAEGISYIISHQTDGSHPAPAQLVGRPDVTIYTLAGRGLSANRNNALAHATADLLVLADDDITLIPQYLDDLRQLADAHHETDIFTLQAFTPEGKPLHYYPDAPFTHPHVPKGFYYNSMGIVLRKGRDYPPFDTRFGLGAPHLMAGEEDIFIHESHLRHLRIDYYPQPLLITPGVTTSSHYATDSRLQQTKGAVLALIHSTPGALLRYVSTAIKMRRMLAPMPHLRNLVKGMKYIHRHATTH